MKALLAGLVATGVLLAGCGHPPPPADPLGSLEASVDAIAGQVDSDSSG